MILCFLLPIVIFFNHYRDDFYIKIKSFNKVKNQHVKQNTFFITFAGV